MLWQPTDQPANQLTNQPTDQPTDGWTDQQTDRQTDTLAKRMGASRTNVKAVSGNCIAFIKV